MVNMRNMTDYIEELTKELNDELMHRIEVGLYKNSEVFRPASRSDLYDDVEGFVSGRDDGSQTMNKAESAENIRMFLFTDYWEDFIASTGLVYLSRYEDLEALEVRFRSYLIRSLWPEALLTLAGRIGISKSDVDMLLSDTTRR